MRGEDLRKLKEEEDEERERRVGEGEEKDSVALVAEERKRVVEEAEEEAAATATAVPKTVAAMDLVEIEQLEGEAIGNECDGSVSCRAKRSAIIWGFSFFAAYSLLLFWMNLAYSNHPPLATRFFKSTFFS